MILLDTHVLIWLTKESASLGQRSRAAYDRAIQNNEVAISVVSYWELGMLVAKGRLEAAHAPAYYRQNIRETAIIELPLTGDIAILAAELRLLHGDPADRFIAATALAHGATLMTADRRLLAWDGDLAREDATQ